MSTAVESMHETRRSREPALVSETGAQRSSRTEDRLTDTESQKSSFLEIEGDRYFERNRSALKDWRRQAEQDPLLRELARLRIRPEAVLEIGCSNGWRLRAMQEAHPEARLCGIDPSRLAVDYGRKNFPGLHLQCGSADDLPFETAGFDLVLFGFCLYLMDRCDLFRIAAEADRVLRDGGVVVTLDFHPDGPTRTQYHHREGVYSYKMDYGRMFLWNPAYRCIGLDLSWPTEAVRGDLRERLGVVAAVKNLDEGYAAEPHAS